MKNLTNKLSTSTKILSLAGALQFIPSDSYALNARHNGKVSNPYTSNSIPLSEGLPNGAKYILSVAPVFAFCFGFSYLARRKLSEKEEE